MQYYLLQFMHAQMNYINFLYLAEEIFNLDFSGHKLCVVTDSNGAPLYLSEVKEHLIYRRILFIILWFLCIVSYVMQVSLILTTEYKLAMCMNIICVFSIMGLNNTVYSIGNCKKYI